MVRANMALWCLCEYTLLINIFLPLVELNSSDLCGLPPLELPQWGSPGVPEDHCSLCLLAVNSCGLLCAAHTAASRSWLPAALLSFPWCCHPESCCPFMSAAFLCKKLWRIMQFMPPFSSPGSFPRAHECHWALCPCHCECLQAHVHIPFCRLHIMARCHPTVFSRATVSLRAVAQSWVQLYCPCQGMVISPSFWTFHGAQARSGFLLTLLIVYGNWSWKSLLGLLNRTSFPTPLLGHSVQAPQFFLSLLWSWDQNDPPRILPCSSPMLFSERDVSHWGRFLRVLIVCSSVILLSCSWLMEVPIPLHLSSDISPQFTILNLLLCKKEFFLCF